jgi:hypothetical protein
LKWKIVGRILVLWMESSSYCCLSAAREQGGMAKVPQLAMHCPFLLYSQQAFISQVYKVGSYPDGRRDLKTGQQW